MLEMPFFTRNRHRRPLAGVLFCGWYFSGGESAWQGQHPFRRPGSCAEFFEVVIFFGMNVAWRRAFSPRLISRVGCRLPADVDSSTFPPRKTPPARLPFPLRSGENNKTLAHAGLQFFLLRLVPLERLNLLLAGRGNIFCFSRLFLSSISALRSFSGQLRSLFLQGRESSCAGLTA